VTHPASAPAGTPRALVFVPAESRGRRVSPRQCPRRPQKSAPSPPAAAPVTHWRPTAAPVHSHGTEGTRLDSRDSAKAQASRAHIAALRQPLCSCSMPNMYAQSPRVLPVFLYQRLEILPCDGTGPWGWRAQPDTGEAALSGNHGWARLRAQAYPSAKAGTVVCSFMVLLESRPGGWTSELVPSGGQMASISRRPRVDGNHGTPAQTWKTITDLASPQRLAPMPPFKSGALRALAFLRSSYPTAPPTTQEGSQPAQCPQPTPDPQAPTSPQPNLFCPGCHQAHLSCTRAHSICPN